MAESDRGAALAPTVSAEAVRPDSSAPSRAALPIGVRLGERYEVRGYLGEGGMGAVYRAYDDVLGIEVALKSVRGHCATEAQLRDEVRVAQRITHPNVCRIFDLVDVEGRHFIKMEYIAGETLHARIENTRRLSIDETVRIARAVADGLAAAHRKGIIHRDLKPANVMLASADERVVLMDFGLARATAEASHDRAGTPSYMSPEQLAGQELDDTSDLFALGCLVFEMLTGRRAFHHGGGSLTELASHRQSEPAPSVAPARPDAPRWLATAVGELLSTDRELRKRGRARLVRGPRRWPIVAAIVVGAAAIGAVAWWGLQPEPPWQPRIEKLYAYTGNAQPPDLSSDGTTLLLTQDPENAGRWGVYTMPIAPARGGQPRLVTPVGWQCNAGRWTRDGQVLAVCLRDGVEHVFRVPIGGAAPVDLGVGIAADDCGDAVAIVERRSTVESRIVLATREGNKQLLASGQRVVRIRCSPSGQHVAAVLIAEGRPEDGALVLVDRAGVQRTLVDREAIEIEFSSEQSLLFTRWRPHGTILSEVDIATGRTRDLTPSEQHARAPTVAGAITLFHRDLTWKPLLELGLDGERTSLTLEQELFHNPVPVPRSTLLVATRTRAARRTIIAIDLASQQIRELAEGSAPFPSRDGKHVYYGTQTKPFELRVVPLDGGPPQTLAPLPGELVAGVDGFDGQHVYVDANAGEAWTRRPDGQLVRSDRNAVVLDAAALDAGSRGWRALWLHPQDNGQLVVVSPPPEADDRHVIDNVHGRPAWIDATQLSYCDPASCKILDVETGAVVQGPKNPTRPPSAIAAGLDGKRWYFTRHAAQVSLHRITNLDDRPRR